MNKHHQLSTFDTYINQSVNCKLLFNTLCLSPQSQWKYDLEEKGLLSFFSRYSADLNYKVIVELDNYVNVPPDNEIESVKAIMAFKINPLHLINEHKPNLTLESLSNEDVNRYAILYGDYNFDCFGRVIPIAELPPDFFNSVKQELTNALEKSKLPI